VAQRLLDRIFTMQPVDERSLRQLTVLVKTFERPKVLHRLVTSIRRLYPTLDVLVVDDSREPRPIQGVQTITMPYDSGIAAGRNEGLEHVTTSYVLVVDDDFVFYRHTLLGPSLALMSRYPEIDIMGGRLIELPLLRARRLPFGDVFPTSAKPIVPLGDRLGGLQVVDKVPTFFIARRDRLALVPWDPRLKRADHADFFTRALGVLTTVFNPELRCLHARTPFDSAYMSKRMDLADSLDVLEERYGAI
jgi:glycosyltransferase involved in cell wall biosynthesis